MRNSANITDRKKLKDFFKKGNLPGESAFEKLIDSTFNIADDKLDISEEGLMIYPSENGKEKLLSFFEDRDDQKATWVMYATRKPDKGISINQIVQKKKDDNSFVESVEQPALFIQKDGGKIGLGTNSPRQQLEVTGLIASTGRMGTFREGFVEANGDWHNIFDTAKGLEGCNAFEIMCYAEGNKNEGRYSLMHAIAVCTNRNSRPKITKTAAYQGKWWNKIDMRWESGKYRISEQFEKDNKTTGRISKWWKSVFGSRDFVETVNQPDKYNLQVRTKSNYGEDVKLHFRVSELWNSDFKNQ